MERLFLASYVSSPARFRWIERRPHLESLSLRAVSLCIDFAAGDAGTFCNSPRLTLPIGVVTGEAEALDVAMGVPEALG